MKTGFAVAVAATLAFGAILLPGMPASAASDRGVPLLTDDFSMKETFPERWRVGDGKFTDEFGALTRHVYRW